MIIINAIIGSGIGAFLGIITYCVVKDTIRNIKYKRSLKNGSRY